MNNFPKQFFWGAATSAYQVEGGNHNSDWWEWERAAGLAQGCGSACRHYQLYEKDFDLASQLRHNAHRLSVEWARIEPEEGRFSEEAVNHYRDVIRALRRRGMEPVVTLYHFTLPIWFSRLGGWENREAVKYFLRYTEKIVSSLVDQVGLWVTINEPMVYAYHSYILGAWPPQVRSFARSRRVTKTLLLAHIKAYSLIHNIYRRRNVEPPMVSIAKNLQAFAACRPTLKNKLAVYLRNKYYNFDFIKKLIRRKSLDFIGVNYYTRGVSDARSWRIKSLLLDDCRDNCSVLKKNYLGWDIYPEGLYKVLTGLKKYKRPVFILENGICIDDDRLRWDFILQHLKSLLKAISAGVNVMGYIYWSLLDNYEWDKGFGPRFGLVEVDYNNYARKVRESAKKLAQVCQTGELCS